MNKSNVFLLAIFMLLFEAISFKESIANDVTSIFSFQTIEEMKSASNNLDFIPQSAVCIVEGREHFHDGFEGLFHWSPNETRADDGIYIAPEEQKEKGRWVRICSDGLINVKWYGARGDGQHDDTNAIQKAINAAEETNVVLIPDGDYLVSKRLIVKKSEIHLQGRGVLMPTKEMTDYLIEFSKFSRDQVNFKRHSIGARIVVDGLRIDGLNRSRGVFIQGFFHSSFNDIMVSHVAGTAVKLHDVRETQFTNLCINHSVSKNEPLLDMHYDFGLNPDPHGGGWQWPDGKTVDGQNNIRFYGMNLAHSYAPVFINIGGDVGNSPYIHSYPARNIHFTGCQIHQFSGGGTSWWNAFNWADISSKEESDYAIIRIKNASDVTFSQCNLFGIKKIILGDEKGKASEVVFQACRLAGHTIVANNAQNVKVIGCNLHMSNQPENRSHKEVVTGNDASEVEIY